MVKKYYQMLEIAENATSEEIKKAYRKLAQRWHPDKWANKSVEERLKATERMQEINQAFEILGDDEKKKRYDLGATNFSAGTSRNSYEDIGERLRREEEALKEEIGDKKERIRKIGEFLLRSDTIHEIYYELAMNNIYSVDLDSNLWAPYESFGEKIFSIEIGDDENDLDFIDRRKVLAFKNQMIEAIRKRGIEVKRRKEEIELGINVPEVDKARIKAIKRIEEELEISGLNSKDLGEYSNYKEQINSLPKVWRVRSFEDKVIEYIQSRFRKQESETETKQNYSSWQGDQNQQKDQGLNHRDNNSSSSNSYLGKKEFSPDKKDPTELKKGNKKNKYDEMTKEELIKIIHELEAEIRQLKSEKVEESELPEFNKFLTKKQKQLQQKKETLKEMLSLDNGLEKDKNTSQLGSVVLKGVILVLVVGMMMLVIFIKRRRKKLKL